MCVVVNGQVIADKNGFAQIPFGTEYHLRFRNKNNRRAVVKFFIDGEEVSGNGYIIPANDFIEIKRHNDKDRAFKFVDLDSAEATDAGKNGSNDDKTKGTIEARFYLEKEYSQLVKKPMIPWVVGDGPSAHPWKKTGPYPYPTSPYWMKSDDCQDREEQPLVHYSASVGPQDSLKSDDTKKTVGLCSFNSTIDSTVHDANRNVTRSISRQIKDGCTVEGYTTGQSFGTAYISLEDDYCVCRLHLQGYAVEEKVFTHEPQESKYCENCGAKKGKKTAKFCSNCGTKF